jgi:hypothetical protein
MYTAKGRLDPGALLKQYSPLVRRLAHQMIAKLPANVEIDDLSPPQQPPGAALRRLVAAHFHAESRGAAASWQRDSATGLATSGPRS